MVTNPAGCTLSVIMHDPKNNTFGYALAGAGLAIELVVHTSPQVRPW